MFYGENIRLKRKRNRLYALENLSAVALRRYTRQETQPLLTNRATRLEILTFEKYGDLQTGVRVAEGHWKCHHSIQRMRLPIDGQ